MSRTTSYLLRPLVLLMLAALVVSAVAVVLASPPAQAAPFTVTTAADEQNTNAQCSLREAIINANQNDQSGSADCPAGVGQDTITFNLVSPATITLAGSQLPTITDSAGLIIDGGSAKITVSGNNTVRVFEVGTSTISGAKLTLNNLTVANGRALLGGGILNNSSNTLMVNNSTISGNIAYTEGQSGGIGGGIHNSGALTVSNSTISDNNASNAGGIWNNPSSTLTVSNSTVSGNKANFVGGIYNSQGTLTVSNSTISNNTGFLDGVGIYVTTRSTTTLKNTIVANNLAANGLPSGKDCSADIPITDGGYNLDSGTSCGFTTENNSLSSTDPMLGPLADNGGPTMTHALLEGSPAIDKGNSFEATTDQRGVVRPQGTASDIGSFESASTVIEDTIKPTVSTATPTGTGIARGTNLTATFSEKMDPLSITNSTFKLFKVKPDGSTTQITNVRVSLSTDGLVAKLNPFGTSSTVLAANTKYKGVITTGAKDEAGNQLDQDPSTTTSLQQKGWTFTTKG